MTSAFGADDLIKRSLFASIIGFAHKKSKCGSTLSNETSANATSSSRSYRSRSSNSAANVHQRNPYRSLDVLSDGITDGNEYDSNAEILVAKSAALQRCTSSDGDNYLLNRSQQDIYREIVHECAQLENKTVGNISSAQSPFSNSSSQPSSPSTTPSSGVFSSDNDSENVYKVEQEARICDYYHNHISQSQTSSSSCSFETTATTILPSDYESMNKLTIQEFVKIVVTEVKKSILFVQTSDGEGLNESPEQILRRRRAQNNEAAARYRKRQREVREESENELKKLLRKNKELKQQIQQMQSEISRLKCAVISMNAPNSNC